MNKHEILIKILSCLLLELRNGALGELPLVNVIPRVRAVNLGMVRNPIVACEL